MNAATHQSGQPAERRPYAPPSSIGIAEGMHVLARAKRDLADFEAKVAHRVRLVCLTIEGYLRDGGVLRLEDRTATAGRYEVTADGTRLTDEVWLALQARGNIQRVRVATGDDHIEFYGWRDPNAPIAGPAADNPPAPQEASE